MIITRCAVTQTSNLRGKIHCRRQRQRSQVKLIEISLSQATKFGGGSVVPDPKVTTTACGVPVGKDCIALNSQSAFSILSGMMRFIAPLRQLAGGKPVSFELFISCSWERFVIVMTMMLDIIVSSGLIMVDL